MIEQRLKYERLKDLEKRLKQGEVLKKDDREFLLDGINEELDNFYERLDKGEKLSKEDIARLDDLENMKKKLLEQEMAELMEKMKRGELTDEDKLRMLEI